MEKYNAAIVLTDEYQKEQEAAESKWDKENEAANQKALEQIRRHMPVQVRLKISLKWFVGKSHIKYESRNKWLN